MENSDVAPNTSPYEEPPPTDVCGRLRAQQAAVNAQITAISNALPANLSPDQRAALVNQLEAVRAQANAQLQAALAAASCPPAR